MEQFWTLGVATGVGPKRKRRRRRDSYSQEHALPPPSALQLCRPIAFFLVDSMYFLGELVTSEMGRDTANGGCR